MTGHGMPQDLPTTAMTPALPAMNTMNNTTYGLALPAMNNATPELPTTNNTIPESSSSPMEPVTSGLPNTALPLNIQSASMMVSHSLIIWASSPNSGHLFGHSGHYRWQWPRGAANGAPPCSYGCVYGTEARGFWAQFLCENRGGGEGACRQLLAIKG